ncbi:MAG: transcription factor E [Candidatus Hydrothermarchaeales archaeon]
MDDGKLVHNEEVREFLLGIVSDEGLDVVQAITGKEVTDEELSEETGLKLNIIRRILYKLYDYRLASYIRTKDKDIGWYTYTWKLDLSKVSDILSERKRRMLEGLMRNLEFETGHVFFTCKNDNSKVPFYIAGENNFKCPQCNEIMDYADNRGVVMNLEKEIKRLKKEIRH